MEQPTNGNSCFFKSYMVSKKHALKTGLLIKFADCLNGNRLQELQQDRSAHDLRSQHIRVSNVEIFVGIIL